MQAADPVMTAEFFLGAITGLVESMSTRNAGNPKSSGDVGSVMGFTRTTWGPGLSPSIW